MTHFKLTLAPLLAALAFSCAPGSNPAAGQGTRSVAQSAVAPALGTTQSFAVLGGSAVTNTGSTVVTGNLGVSPGTAVTGFPPGLVLGGTVEAANAAALQAQSDATVAYNALAGQACDHNLTGQDLGGLTLTPGTYCFSSSAQLTGTLTLNAQGNPAAVFIFQIGSTLTTASNSSMVTVNGASSCSVYWQVGSSATLGTGTALKGSIIALTSITLTTGASLQGRALARNGAVTLDTSAVSAASCVSNAMDAGTDAGVVEVDAGVVEADAGVVEVDAGVVTVDAGVATVDAGVADAGHDVCEAGCTDLTTDPNNCGACGNVCGDTQTCIAGACVCN